MLPNLQLAPCLPQRKKPPKCEEDAFTANSLTLPPKKKHWQWCKRQEWLGRFSCSWSSREMPVVCLDQVLQEALWPNGKGVGKSYAASCMGYRASYWRSRGPMVGSSPTGGVAVATILVRRCKEVERWRRGKLLSLAALRHENLFMRNSGCSTSNQSASCRGSSHFRVTSSAFCHPVKRPSARRKTALVQPRVLTLETHKHCRVHSSVFRAAVTADQQVPG